MTESMMPDPNYQPTFENFRDLLVGQFRVILESCKPSNLFEVDVDPDEMYNIYLNSFREEDNPIFRERRIHDCNLCKNFIKRFGGVVVITDDYTIRTIWDGSIMGDTYNPVLRALTKYVKSKPIKSFWFSEYKQIGCKQNKQLKYKDKDVNLTFSHLYIEIPDKFTIKRLASLNDCVGLLNDTANVFKRALEEFTVDSLETVLELIEDNNLYRGKEYEFICSEFLKKKKVYDELTDERKKELFIWYQTSESIPSITKIRNTAIGTLLSDLSQGIDLEKAVQSFENKVSGTNYKRSKAIFTSKMLEEFKQTILDLGYADSLKRRFATYDDLPVESTLYLNRDANNIPTEVPETELDDIFNDLKKDVTKKKVKFNPNDISIENMSIDTFVKEILNKKDIESIELYTDDKLSKNFASLITGENPDAKSMFKWDNLFSWAYTGNIADSLLRETVKKRGGNVDGDVRFSISWNEKGDNNTDLDAHCLEPYDCIIFYGSPYVKNGQNKFSKNGGQLDIDIQYPREEIGNAIAVENIAYKDIKKMTPGKYLFSVNCFTNRVNGGDPSFNAELEVLGETYYFHYNQELRTEETVDIATLTINNDGTYHVDSKLPSKASNVRKIWNTPMQSFVPVTAVLRSPNYWNENGIGNEHYFFMLKDCISDETPNGFYNEYLNEELYKHRKAAEALGSKCAVNSSPDQLSGFGFSTTMRNDVCLRVKTSNSLKTYKILF